MEQFIVNYKQYNYLVKKNISWEIISKKHIDIENKKWITPLCTKYEVKDIFTNTFKDQITWNIQKQYTLINFTKYQSK